MSETQDRFRVRVVRDFWSAAATARRRFEEAMRAPYDPAAVATRQCWDYWYVEGQYHYLRADPSILLGADLVEDFLAGLNRYCERRLGDLRPSSPWLTLHTHGMRHELHDDRGNGVFAYVLSLTPEPRRFVGGETRILRAPDNPGPAEEFQFHLVAPAFNQLLLFDDAALHMVSAVEGVVDPLHGRLCLTGHIA